MDELEERKSFLQVGMVEKIHQARKKLIQMIENGRVPISPGALRLFLKGRFLRICGGFSGLARDSC